MGDFQYKTSGGGSWTDVPAAAKEGTYLASARVVYPEATDVAVSGAPCGASGKPRLELRSAIMSAGGVGWWNNLLGTAWTTQSGTLYLTAYDERVVGGTPAWSKWVGLLTRPKVGAVQIAGSVAVYTDVTITVVECVTTS